jgi:hypothetical protein
MLLALLTGDLGYTLAEKHLSAAELVRLCMCCKGLRCLLERPGLLYLPLLRSLPYTTGLAPHRSASYYLSILHNHFTDPGFTPDTARRIRYLLGGHFPFMGDSANGTVRECVRLCRTVCFSKKGRSLILDCLGELWRTNECIMDANTTQAFHRVTAIVAQAFCVQRRRLQPGRVVRKHRRPMDFEAPEYDYESDGGE